MAARWVGYPWPENRGRNWSRIVKDRTGPDLDERSVLNQYITEIQYVTEPGSFFGQINPFLPARRRPTVNHSLVAGGAQRQDLQTCRPDAHKPECLFSRTR